MRSTVTVRTDDEIAERALALGIAAAVAAGQHALTFWDNPDNARFDPSVLNAIIGKGGIGNFATTADQKSERVLLEMIRRDAILGSFTILSEESDGQTAPGDWRWVLDPIDGTLPLRNGAPEFGVAVALLKGQQPMVGIIAMPALGWLIAARRGSGAALWDVDGRLLRDLSGARRPADIPLDQSLVAFDASYERRSHQLTAIAARVIDQVGYLVSYCSPTTAGFRLALGQLGGYIFQRPTLFNIAATAAIVPEIGGVISDLHGSPIDWSAPHRSVLAARSPATHARLLELLSGWERDFDSALDIEDGCR